ncbi:MAG TPA: hypothetical protein VKB69_06130, partial [Micromonosporaceae bacterium]|nr:hypothetical protein [Micromonosporaceae bacterium]
MTDPEPADPSPTRPTDPTPRYVVIIVIVAVGLSVGLYLSFQAPPDNRNFLPVVFWTALAGIIAVYVNRAMQKR